MRDSSFLKVAHLTQWRAEGRRAKRSDGPGYSKSETPKIKMLWQDDFSYCKATHTCCMDLIFRDLCSLSAQTPVILTLLNTRDLYSRCAAIKLIVTWFCPDQAIKGNSQ